MGKFKRADMAERNKARMINYDGVEFEYFTVIHRIEPTDNGRQRFLCKCICGKEFVVLGTPKRVKSCGCMTKKILSDAQTKHNGSRTKLFNKWCKIKARCNYEKHKSYKDYGGRGIKMCEEWENDFGAFRDWAYANGYDENDKFLQIDRIDNNKGYSPENCRWTTPKENCNNRRNNHIIEYNGQKHTLSEWLDAIEGIKRQTVEKRICKGWSAEKAFNTPCRYTKNQPIIIHYEKFLH